MILLLSRDKTIIKNTASKVATRIKTTQMEDLDESISSTESASLFIQEEEADPARTLMEHRDCNKAQSELSFTGTQLNQLALTKPYLREMDELLKSCEELTAAPRSHFSASCKETSLTESTNSHTKAGDFMESRGRETASSQAYLFTSYIDTHMDGVGTEDQRAQGLSHGSGTIMNRCGVSTDDSCQREMPLTSAGHKLSDTMVAYEGQLLGMLAMLESCMEEAGMDFEPQDCVMDASQEYVHISKNPSLCRGTTLVPIQQEKSLKLETQKMASESWAGQHVGRGELSNGSRDEATVSSETNGGLQNLVLNCGKMASFSVEHLEKQGNVKTNQNFDPQFRFSTENDTVWREMPETGYISTNEGTCAKRGITGIEADSTDLPAEVGNEPKMVIADLGSGTGELAILGSLMEECIEEVQRLQERRKELLAEVLELRGGKDRQTAEGICEEDTDTSTDRKVVELMNVLKREEQGRREERKREIQGLREERAEEERRIWRVNLERQGLQEEHRKLKRRLFVMARDCAHNQFALNTQHREVEQLKREEVTKSSGKQSVLHISKKDSSIKFLSSCLPGRAAVTCAPADRRGLPTPQCPKTTDHGLASRASCPEFQSDL